MPAGTLCASDLRSAAGCYQNASMANVLVRDLPEDVHAALQQRAEAAGQSLQQYLTAELTRLARTPSMSDVLARIGRRRGGRVGLADALADLDEARGQR